MRFTEGENERKMRVEERKEVEGGREWRKREWPSCMSGVSGRFLCDLQAQAWSQRSADATETPRSNRRMKARTHFQLNKSRTA